MKLKFFLISLLMICCSPSIYADEGLNISYKVPFVPLEITFDSDGISFNGTKTIVTPLGSFSLGYSKYASKFDEDYTYVIIEDMNLKKEHIYKIKDKKKLKLITEGRTEITITKNRVRIVVEKGSHFTVKFSVEGESGSYSSVKWIDPSNSVCRSHGGKVKSDGCEANWENAKEICSASGGSLPSIEVLKKVVSDCGGKIAKFSGKIMDSNVKNTSYQSCYQKNKFTFNPYWSSSLSTSKEILSNPFSAIVAISTHDNSRVVSVISFHGAYQTGAPSSIDCYIRCVRDGQ